MSPVPTHVHVHTPPLPPPPSSLRLSDLHRHMRQQSRLVSMTTPITDEDPAGGVWPNVTSGGKGGKKGDILKLVCWASTLSLSISLLFFLSIFSSFSSTLAPLLPLYLLSFSSPSLSPSLSHCSSQGMLVLCLSRGMLEVSSTAIPDDLPNSLRDFLQKCLHPNELLRLPAHELLNHPFITPSPSPSHPRTLSPSHPTLTHLTTNTGTCMYTT